MIAKAKKPPKRPTHPSMTDAPPPLCELAQDVRKLWNGAARKELMTRHQIGLHVDEAMSAPGKYGAEVLPRLAAVLGTSSSLLYSCRKLAVTWDQQQLQRLRKRTTTTGRRIEFTPLVLISAVGALKERNRLIAEFFAKDLTVRELDERVRQLTGRSKSAAAVRPGTPAAGLKAMQRMAESYAEKCPIWREVVFDQITEAIAEHDISHLESMRETRKSQNDIKKRAEQNIQLLDVCIRDAEKEREEIQKANHRHENPTPSRPDATKRRPRKPRTPANQGAANGGLKIAR